MSDQYQSLGEGKHNTIDIYSSPEVREGFLEDEQKLARERGDGGHIPGSWNSI